MALATLPASPCPYESSMMMMDLPMAPFLPRQLIPEQLQHGCSSHLSSFQFPNPSTKHPSLKLSMRPRRNSDSRMLQKSLKRMSLRGDAKKRRDRVQAETDTSVHALAASLMAARNGKPRFAKLSPKNSPVKTAVQRSASFGRARLSPVRAAPVRTRSCGGLVF